MTRVVVVIEEEPEGLHSGAVTTIVGQVREGSVSFEIRPPEAVLFAEPFGYRHDLVVGRKLTLEFLPGEFYASAVVRPKP